MSPPRIIDLDSIVDNSAGGKAYGLARLQRMGLAVPPAFVICNAAQGEFPADLDRYCASLDSDRVAVRSSAVGEDGGEASFAGQYDTVLNVKGSAALRAAIDRCVSSAAHDRAASYRRDRDSRDAPSMNVVVQAMVDAHRAGVVFTADPVSGRRDVAVIDAVAGLGEALVSGEVTPDHYLVDSAGSVLRNEPAGSEALLDAQQLRDIVDEARAAEAVEGRPLDLEWAMDADGGLFWLQARPVTTLPADLNEFDTPLPRPDDVLTISNISEMMPGAVCPLTGSFTGWCIDYGLQHMQVAVGARRRIESDWQITAWAYGHLFLNLSGNVVMSAGVLGSTPEQTAQTLCGRNVPELKAMPPLPLWRRVINTGRLLHYALSAPAVVRRFGEEVAAFAIPARDDSAAQWREIKHSLHFYEHAMAVHIQSSALSGFLCAIVENMVSGRSNDSTGDEQGEAVRLLAGATEVESAVMLEELDRLVDRIAGDDGATQFRDADAPEALAWLRATQDMELPRRVHGRSRTPGLSRTVHARSGLDRRPAAPGAQYAGGGARPARHGYAPHSGDAANRLELAGARIALDTAQGPRRDTPARADQVAARANRAPFQRRVPPARHTAASGRLLAGGGPRELFQHRGTRPPGGGPLRRGGGTGLRAARGAGLPAAIRIP
ncbi:MAG: PEP/pyruvate-binding domain-containing protein [Halioglobus sp.]|nr:PEP/pyruvate-binding domain-containing protein [Halioglobus sp.]